MQTIIRNKIKALFAVFLMACFTACTDDNVSELMLSGDCSIEALTLDNYEGKIDLASRTVTVNLPETYDTRAMTVTELRISEGASANMHEGQTVNMEGVQNVHITNGDLYLDWKLVAKRDEAKISSFIINEVYNGIIDQNAKTITVYVPGDVDITALIPSIEFSEGATCQPLNGVAQDFSSPVVYTVTNGTAQAQYTVTVFAIDKPKAVFVGNASTMSDLDPEAKEACSWMLANIEKSLYASFADIQSEAVDLSECKVIWWHFHYDGGVDGHEQFVTKAPYALDAKNQLRTYYENGGSFFLTRYATNLPSFIGATGDDEWTTPNNCWGQNEADAELCGGPWDFKKYSPQAAHPLWQGLVAGDDPNAVYTTDAGYHITNSTAQYHIGTDWGGYDNHEAWEARTGGKILGIGGDGAIVAWEYLPHNGKGGIICIGSGCYDWYSYTFEAGYTEKFHKNVAIITQNAFNYLSK